MEESMATANWLLTEGGGMSPGSQFMERTIAENTRREKEGMELINMDRARNHYNRFAGRRSPIRPELMRGPLGNLPFYNIHMNAGDSMYQEPLRLMRELASPVQAHIVTPQRTVKIEPATPGVDTISLAPPEPATTHTNRVDRVNNAAKSATPEWENHYMSMVRHEEAKDAHKEARVAHLAARAAPKGVRERVPNRRLKERVNYNHVLPPGCMAISEYSEQQAYSGQCSDGNISLHEAKPAIAALIAGLAMAEHEVKEPPKPVEREKPTKDLEIYSRPVDTVAVHHVRIDIDTLGRVFTEAIENGRTVPRRMLRNEGLSDTDIRCLEASCAIAARAARIAITGTGNPIAPTIRPADIEQAPGNRRSRRGDPEDPDRHPGRGELLGNGQPRAGATCPCTPDQECCGSARLRSILTASCAAILVLAGALLGELVEWITAEWK
jgi:hypothetical protein